MDRHGVTRPLQGGSGLSPSDALPAVHSSEITKLARAPSLVGSTLAPAEGHMEGELPRGRSTEGTHQGSWKDQRQERTQVGPEDEWEVQQARRHKEGTLEG